MAVDEARLEELIGRVAVDLGASLSAALVGIGDRLGLYRALADIGPATPAELADRTGTRERYVREWLINQAASGYVSYDAEAERFHMSEEQALALADEDSQVNMIGGFYVASSAYLDASKMVDRFRSGDGLAWGDHHHNLFEGTERLFAPGYRANLVGSWIPALDGVEEKLRSGALVADVGCGHGASTIIMARAFPASRFVGFDNHAGSVEQANERARQAGVDDRVRFEVAGASDFPGEGYDLVAHFDCFHDLGDPAGAGRHVRDALADDGTWMIVEPNAGDRVEDQFNPVGRLFSAASTVICVPSSLADHDHGAALGAVAGEARTRAVVEGSGFGRFRRATETPFNLVYEARI
jgi:SAM-dependent methyltransferase